MIPAAKDQTATVPKSDLEQESQSANGASSDASANPSSQLASIGVQGSIALAGSLIGRALQLVVQVLLARKLGPANFGYFSLGFIVLQGMGVLTSLSLDACLLRFLPRYLVQQEQAKAKGTLQLALAICALFSLLGALLWFCGVPFLPFAAGNDNYRLAVQVFAFALPFYVLLNVGAAALRALKAPSQSIMLRDVAPYGLHFCFVLLLLFWGLTVFNVITALSLAFVVTSLLVLVQIARKTRSWRTTAPVYETRELLAFSLPVAGLMICRFLNTRVDALFTGTLLTPALLGIYQSALVFAALMPIILNAFNTILAPIISELHTLGKIEELGDLLKTSARWMLTIGLLPFILLVLYGDKFLLLLFGPEYLPAWPALVALFAGQVCNLAVGSVGFILVMSGHQNVVLRNTLVLVALGLPLTWFLILHWGIMGAALATAVTTTIDNMVRMFQVRQLIGIHPFNRAFIKPISAGLLAFAVGWLLRGMLNEAWWAVGMLGVMIAFGLCLLALGFDAVEKDMIRQVMGRMRRAR